MTQTPLKTFEFGEWFPIDRTPLQAYLEAVWEAHHPTDEEVEPNATLGSGKKGRQGFLEFDGDNARAKNYIGFIQMEDFQLEIYPKVFRSAQFAGNPERLIMQHVFFWFDYCRKWKFPVTQTALDNLNCDSLPELLINLMSAKILDIITEMPLMLYEQVEESLSVPRGRINFDRYLVNGFSHGNQHILECDHELLLHDNRLNRIIKYATRLLKNKAKFPETQSRLDDILFVLDEVGDEPCSMSDLNQVRLNKFFGEYQSIIDICRLILNQEIYNHNYQDQSHWSLLFPMEYIFEDFVAGFIENELNDEWVVEYQKSDMYLTDRPNQAFQMRHDLLLTAVKDDTIKIIVDTKYKLRPEDYEDKKQGIAQSDMYQMAAYALRRGCPHVLLLYPNYQETCRKPGDFVISSGFETTHQIRVTTAEIPFWSKTDFGQLKINLANTLRTLLNDQ